MVSVRLTPLIDPRLSQFFAADGNTWYSKITVVAFRRRAFSPVAMLKTKCLSLLITFAYHDEAPPSMALSAMYHVREAPPSIQLMSKSDCVKKLYAAVGLMFAKFAYTIPNRPLSMLPRSRSKCAYLSIHL